jgi:hypothetical protein
VLVQSIPYPASGGGTGNTVYSHHTDVGPYSSGAGSSGAAATGLSTTIIAADLQPNTDYLVLWSAEGQANATSSTVGVELRIDGSVVRTQTGPMKDTSPGDWIPYGGIARFQVGATPADTTLAITYYIAGGGATSATLRNLKITRLKLGADDRYAEQTAVQNNATTSYTTAASLSFTPGSSGDYLVLYSFSFGTNNSGIRGDFRIGDGTTTFASGLVPAISGQLAPIMLAQRFNAVSGAKTFSVEHKSQSTTVRTDDITIVALRLDRFSDVRTTALGADSSGTQTTYTTAATQTFTPTAGDYLTLGLFGMESNSNALASFSRLVDDGTQLGEHIRTPQSNAINWTFMGGLMQTVATYAAASRTQTIDRKSETTSVTTTVRSVGMIASLRLTGLT